MIVLKTPSFNNGEYNDKRWVLVMSEVLIFTISESKAGYSLEWTLTN